MGKFSRKRRAQDSLSDASFSNQSKRFVQVGSATTSCEVNEGGGNSTGRATRAPLEAENVNSSEMSKPAGVSRRRRIQGPTESYGGVTKHDSRSKELSKTANKCLKEFRETLQIQGEKLDRAIGMGEAQLLASDAKLLRGIRDVYELLFQQNASKGGRDSQASTTSDTVIGGLHRESVAAISRAQGLIDLFHEANTSMMCEDVTKSTIEEWDREVQDTKRILDIGRRLGERKVEKILYNSYGELATPSEDTMKTSELFYEATDGREDDVNWARTARKHEKAIIRLATTLSRD